MTVVSNTSPITSLHSISELRLLRLLYEKIYIPPAVYDELQVGVERGNHPPLDTEREWLIAHPVSDAALTASLRSLDRGEAQAIALALELNADLLLMDERLGRRIAQSLGLSISGTLGVIVDAKREGIIDLARPIVDRLMRQAGFWISENLYKRVLASVGE